MSKAFKIWYGINVETREHALRGWNWGKAEFTKAELAFNVQNRPAFEVPYSEISNTNLAGKNEVAVELSLSTDGNDESSKPAGSTKNRGRKAAAGPDELVEMRFYIPGTAVKTESGIKEENPEEKENGEEGGEEGGEEQNAANLFYELLMEKAEIGDVAGDTFATFLDVLHLTPRYAQCDTSAFFYLILTMSTEADSISICMSLRSGCAERHTITRFSIPLLRNSSCFPRTTTHTHSLFSASNLRSARVRPVILSLLCS